MTTLDFSILCYRPGSAVTLPQWVCLVLPLAADSNQQLEDIDKPREWTTTAAECLGCIHLLSGDNGFFFFVYHKTL